MSEPQVASGKTRVNACRACGQKLEEVEFIGAYTIESNWSLHPHDAPCGLPCFGADIPGIVYKTARRTGIHRSSHHCPKCNSRPYDEWQRFMSGYWQKEIPRRPGLYPVAFLDGAQDLSGRLVYMHKDEPKSDVGWDGWWWSEPYPGLPPIPDVDKGWEPYSDAAIPCDQFTCEARAVWVARGYEPFFYRCDEHVPSVR
jgi:hypothetical protein